MFGTGEHCKTAEATASQLGSRRLVWAQEVNIIMRSISPMGRGTF